MYTLLHYVTVTGRDPFQEWLDGLMDRQAQAQGVDTNRRVSWLAILVTQNLSAGA